MANREEVRWWRSPIDAGEGAVFINTKEGNGSICTVIQSVWSLITARHPHLASQTTNTYLELDAGATGLGGNSCG